MPSDNERLRDMYRHRFDDDAHTRVDIFWDVLFEQFLAARVAGASTILDLGAGGCEFINRVTASRRIAVDLNPDTKEVAALGVEVLLTRSTSLEGIDTGSVDLVFSSNFFEHLSTPQELEQTLVEAHRVLTPQGRILVLMPNLRAVGPRYFDYLDHTLLVTDRSLVEALGLAGFRVDEVIDKFVPYGENPAGVVQRNPRPIRGGASTRRFELMLRTYLKLPFVWRFFGGQMFVAATRLEEVPAPGSRRSH